MKTIFEVLQRGMIVYADQGQGIIVTYRPDAQTFNIWKAYSNGLFTNTEAFTTNTNLSGYSCSRIKQYLENHFEEVTKDFPS